MSAAVKRKRSAVAVSRHSRVLRFGLLCDELALATAGDAFRVLQKGTLPFLADGSVGGKGYRPLITYQPSGSKRAWKKRR